MNNDIAIWWLNQEACEITEAGFKSNLKKLPAYIKDEFYSRVGRPGRGRLWIPSEIPLKEIKWKDSHPLSKYAKECGGIIFWKKDYKEISGLPGFITDIRMNPVQLSS